MEIKFHAFFMDGSSKEFISLDHAIASNPLFIAKQEIEEFFEPNNIYPKHNHRFELYTPEGASGTVHVGKWSVSRISTRKSWGQIQEVIAQIISPQGEVRRKKMNQNHINGIRELATFLINAGKYQSWDMVSLEEEKIALKEALDELNTKYEILLKKFKALQESNK
jgi:hypothetical protein